MKIDGLAFSPDFPFLFGGEGKSECLVYTVYYYQNYPDFVILHINYCRKILSVKLISNQCTQVSTCVTTAFRSCDILVGNLVHA